MSNRPDSAVDYKPISDYGVIGDMHTAALVGLDGSIDWYCAPRFDSPSVFAAILDARKGGRFQLSPVESFTTKQSYEGDSNVLTTVFETKRGKIKLTDFMPCFMEQGELKGFDELHRIVDCSEGEVELRITFQPRLDYARGETILQETKEGYMAKCEAHQVNLASSVKLQLPDKDTLTTEFGLSKGKRAIFIIKWGKSSSTSVAKYDTGRKLTRTLSYWKRWVGHVKYQGPYRAQVVRSCLVLKLLQYAPTGAMVAAVTTSLPESIGALRNWDYRYSWIRDNALSVWALSEAGATREALDYTRWMINVRRHSKEKSDSGIWEMRQARPFVESKMWCYVALDRAIKIARELGYDDDWHRWDPVKKKIKTEILSNGWSNKKKAFTMVLGGDELDAANLLMPLVGFLPAKDAKMTSTIQHIREELSKGDLIYRYNVDDGQMGKEGAFTVCSFWMVDCLTRLGKLGEAEGLLNQLLKRGNHLGLYSEEIDPVTGDALGNFPQAYTHMGLITASVRLEEARRKTGFMRYARALSNRISS